MIISRTPRKETKGTRKNNSGLIKKGEHLSPSTEIKKGERKSVKTEFKKGMKPWNKGKHPEYMQGENHWKWKGDKVGYGGIHGWVKKKLGRPSKCEKCGTTKSKRFMWHNKSGKYKRSIKDWQRLCVICHNNIHKNWEKKK